jgi:hypothetical protein
VRVTITRLGSGNTRTLDRNPIRTILLRFADGARPRASGARFQQWFEDSCVTATCTTAASRRTTRR